MLHPEHGTKLRFAAISSSIPIECNENTIVIDYTPCWDCSICIDVCPINILEPYKLKDISACLSNSHNMAEKDGQLVPCDICLKDCPEGLS